MHVTLRFAAVGLLLACQGGLASCQELSIVKPEEVGISSEKVEELAKFMQSLVDEGKIAGGVTMMARQGKVVHLKAVGLMDIEAKQAMTTDAIFRIASMSKPITSAGIMILWERGKLKLDDPVSKFIPAFKHSKVLVAANPLQTTPATREITIRHLLTHTSGLGFSTTQKIGPLYTKYGIEGGGIPTETTLADNINNLAELPLLFHPGSEWLYGMSADVLGRVIEVVSRTPLDRFIADEVCHPLGMNDTFFQVPEKKLPRLASLYAATNKGLRKIDNGETLELKFGAGICPISSDYVCTKSNRYLAGGYGLCSTAPDFMRFCQMIMNGGRIDDQRRLLRKETVELMTANQIGNLDKSPESVGGGFGFGFAIWPSSDRIHEQLRGAYSWGGFWNTKFRISPVGHWVLITMSQLVPGESGNTWEWNAKFEALAADSLKQ